MVFASDMNSTWMQGQNGYLYNNELSGITINPGETKELSLVLRKKMTEDNTGIVNNRAEILEVSNSMNLPNSNLNAAGNNSQNKISAADIIVRNINRARNYICINNTYKSIYTYGTNVYCK